MVQDESPFMDMTLGKVEDLEDKDSDNRESYLPKES
jgi:hypothetical protein